jgi:hypothetical protein
MVAVETPLEAILEDLQTLKYFPQLPNYCFPKCLCQD